MVVNEGLRVVHILWQVSFPCNQEWQTNEWHRVMGARISRATEFIASTQAQMRVLILAVVMEPLRYLTAWLLAAAREVQDLSRPPRLFDVVAPARSPFYVVAQYYSSLLRGKGARLAFIFRFAGCSTFEEWSDRNPECLKVFQIAVVVAASWVQRRHIDTHAEFPWRAVGIGDRHEFEQSRFSWHGHKHG